MRKFNLRHSVAIAVYTVLVAVLLFSCSSENKNCKYKLVVTSHNGSGWDKSWYRLECDSVNMLSTKKAEVFIDGTKMIIETDNRITVHTNCN